MIFPDMQMILFSRQIIKDKPNAKIVFDVKCSKLLSDEIMKLGGKPLICKTGHTFIKQKIREEEAFLGGEMSGHIFLMTDGLDLMMEFMQELECSRS